MFTPAKKMMTFKIYLHPKYPKPNFINILGRTVGTIFYGCLVYSDYNRIKMWP